MQKKFEHYPYELLPQGFKYPDRYLEISTGINFQSINKWGQVKIKSCNKWGQVKIKS